MPFVRVIARLFVCVGNVNFGITTKFHAVTLVLCDIVLIVRNGRHFENRIAGQDKKRKGVLIMAKFMDINGETFQVIKPREHKPALTNPYFMRDLYDCYDRPSATKQAIYDEWYEWYRNDSRLTEFGITSYNTFSFTIGCVFQDDETGEAGYISITPAHNKIFMV